jgi:pimeloyl-ACP methyl ester carboxylesterase
MTARTDAQLHTEVELAGLTGDLYGEPDTRPPLVLLHGLTFDRQIWQPVLDRLAVVDPGRCVLALDLPGHGDSPGQPPHTFDRILAVLNRALGDVGFAAPVLVGHSMSGGLVSLYAGSYATSGVINLDAAPDLANFATMLQSMTGQIRGAGFPRVWDMMRAGFHTDLLPPEFRELIAVNCRPDQDLVVSYWAELLDTEPKRLGARVRDGMRRVAATGAPYLFIAGAEPSAEVRDLFNRETPNAEVEVWAGGGHFPHLAHLDRFVARLAATGREWTERFEPAATRGPDSYATSAEVPPVRRSSSA